MSYNYSKMTSFYYRNNIKDSKAMHLILEVARKLYNEVVYLDCSNESEVYDKIKNSVNYRILGSEISTSVIKNYYNNLSNYIRNNSGYNSKNLDKPSFRSKKSEFFLALYVYKGSFSLRKINNSKSNGYELSLNVPDSFIKHFNDKNIKIKRSDFVFRVYNIPSFANSASQAVSQVRLHTSATGQYFVFVAKKGDIPITNLSDIFQNQMDRNILGIDLGVENLVSAFPSKEGKPFIIKGRKIKNINSKYLIEKKFDLKKALKKRKGRLSEYLNRSVLYIIRYSLKYNIKCIVCGEFKNIKEDNVSTQFYLTPYLLLKRKLSAAAKKNGISVIYTEESYTSKCSAFTLEPLAYSNNYQGERVERGLFTQTVNNCIISYNCDINGAANIIRKKFRNAIKLNDKRLLLNPIVKTA